MIAIFLNLHSMATYRKMIDDAAMDSVTFFYRR